MTRASSSPRRITGGHVLAILVTFFAIVFAVNGVFLYAALSTHTGVVSDEPYRKGLHYNDRVAADEAQERLGWAGAIAVGEDSRRLAFAVTRQDGAPVRGLTVQAVIARPATAGHDVTLAMRETEPGRYETSLGPLEPGAWIATIHAAQGASSPVVYRLRKRLWLTP